MRGSIVKASPRLYVLALLSALASACGGFDDPAIVYDMRVLGAIAEPPEVLVPADPDAIDPLALPEIEVCALVADPGASRELSYSMVACPKNEEGRCTGVGPEVNLGSGTVGDPEQADAPVSICATLGPNPALVQVIERSISLDALSGFGAIDIQIGIEIWPAGNNLDQTIYASKQVRFGVQEPAQRTANQNPGIEKIIVTRSPVGPRGLDFELPIGRCGDVDAAIVAPGEEIGILPVDVEDSREDYVVPTFDGDVRMFSETIDYQFFSTAGKWARDRSGGGRDLSGLLPPTDTRWTAPDDAEEIGSGLDVSLFVIQRDERGGQSWLQSCVRVVP